MKNKSLNISNIPTNVPFDGYLWWSDETVPKVYDGEKIPELPASNNPFIVEGQLYDPDNKKSYAIRFVDGDYLINCFDLKKLNGLDSIVKEYIPNRIDGKSKLYFKEFWRPVKDELCEGMEVLKPAEFVFIGFKLI